MLTCTTGSERSRREREISRSGISKSARLDWASGLHPEKTTTETGWLTTITTDHRPSILSSLALLTSSTPRLYETTPLSSILSSSLRLRRAPYSLDPTFTRARPRTTAIELPRVESEFTISHETPLGIFPPQHAKCRITTHNLQPVWDKRQGRINIQYTLYINT